MTEEGRGSSSDGVKQAGAWELELGELDGESWETDKREGREEKWSFTASGRPVLLHWPCSFSHRKVGGRMTRQEDRSVLLTSSNLELTVLG